MGDGERLSDDPAHQVVEKSTWTFVKILGHSVETYFETEKSENYSI